MPDDNLVSKCLRCRLSYPSVEERCPSCGSLQIAMSNNPNTHSGEAAKFTPARVLTRIFLLSLFLLVACYASFLKTSDRLSIDQRYMVERAIDKLQQSGFSQEAFLLNNITSFRTSDHWWNRHVGHGKAYASTNFPFEIMTLYPEFFNATEDDTERAVILLHECYHLRGYGEDNAYTEVWKRKDSLGYSADKYSMTRVWSNMRENTQTKTPNLFICGESGTEDCTAKNTSPIT